MAQRNHDALAEAMRRLLSSNLLPQRAGAPVKAAVHIPLARIRGMDGARLLEDAWIEEYRARWAAHRAADAYSPGDGGAWLDGEAARAVLCDAMVVPVVLGDIDPGKIEELITACVSYHHLRTRASEDAGAVPPAVPGAADLAETLAELERQVLGLAIDLVSNHITWCTGATMVAPASLIFRCTAGITITSCFTNGDGRSPPARTGPAR